MSCHILAKSQIDECVYALTFGYCEREKIANCTYICFGDWENKLPKTTLQEWRNELGRVLWFANLHATRERYPDDVDGKRPGPVGFRDKDVDEYEWSQPDEIHVSEMLTTIDHLMYNAEEGRGDELVNEHLNRAIEVQGTQAMRVVKNMVELRNDPDSPPWSRIYSNWV